MSSPVVHLTTSAARTGENIVRGLRSAVDAVSARTGNEPSPASGWLVVTVFCEPSDIDATELPPPLATFRAEIEVRVERAPGGKGTELAVRPTGRTAPGTAPSRLTGTDPVGRLRAALREAKQLLEVGEVLAVDPAPHGERTATPGGVLLEAWTKIAPRAGVR